MGEERKERRDYLKKILGIAVGLVIGGVSSWFAKPKEIERVRVTETVGPTVTERATETVPGPTETVTKTIFGPTVTEVVTKTTTTTATVTETITSTATILYENRLDSNEDLHRFADDRGVYYEAWLGNSYLGKDLFIDLVDSPVHSPPNACRLRVTKPWLDDEGKHRRLSVRVMVNDWTEFYAFCWHYFPSSHQNKAPASLMAYKEANDGRPMRTWRLYIRPYPDHRIYATKQNFADVDGVKNEWESFAPTQKIPLDRWFRTGVYVKRAKYPDGIVRFYFNDEMIFERKGVETVRYPESPHWVTVHFNYVESTETTSLTNYFDDVIISDKFLNS